MHKKTICVFLVSGIAMIIAGCSSGLFSPRLGEKNRSTNDLSLTIQLDNDTYESEDPIFISVALKNNSNSKITVKNRMLPSYAGWDIKQSKFHDVVYYIESPSGKFVQLGIRYRAPELSAGDFISLLPGASIRFSFDLTENRIFPDEYGVYSVSMVYYNYYDPSWLSTAWKGELQSNTVYFEIKP